MDSIEAAASLLPLEHLFALVKSAPTGVKQMVTAILEQAGLSGGEAVVSQLGNELADTFIMATSRITTEIMEGSVEDLPKHAGPNRRIPAPD